MLMVWRHTSAFPSTLRHGPRPGGRPGDMSFHLGTLDPSQRSQKIEMGLPRPFSELAGATEAVGPLARMPADWSGVPWPRERTAGTAAQRLRRTNPHGREHLGVQAYAHGLVHTNGCVYPHALWTQQPRSILVSPLAVWMAWCQWFCLSVPWVPHWPVRAAWGPVSSPSC